MPDRAVEQGSGAPVAASMQSGVNLVPPGSVTLYDELGHAVNVQAGDADYWMQKGFSRAPFDIASLSDEIDTLFDSAKTAVLEFADHAIEGEMLDGSENGLLAQAQVAMTELITAYRNLMMSATLSKSVDNGAKPVTVRENGMDILVDPGQKDPESRKPVDLSEETDPAIVPEAIKAMRAKAALDDAGVPDQLRPSHLRSDPSATGDLIP